MSVHKCSSCLLQCQQLAFGWPDKASRATAMRVQKHNSSPVSGQQHSLGNQICRFILHELIHTPCHVLHNRQPDIEQKIFETLKKGFGIVILTVLGERSIAGSGGLGINWVHLWKASIFKSQTSKGASTLCRLAECNAMQQKFLGIRRKTDHMHIKKNFLPTVSQFKKTVEWETHICNICCAKNYIYTKLTANMGAATLRWYQYIANWVYMLHGICNMPWHAEAVPHWHLHYFWHLPHGKATLCCILPCGIVWRHLN